MFHVKRYDVIVVGGGHAGCEAAAAAARTGAKVAMVTMRPDMVGAMSCNPAIGGIGKGHIVREVDAFDGIIGVAADRAAIHYRMLNARKGKAVHGPRVQADRELYKAAVTAELSTYKTLSIIKGEVESLNICRGFVEGVRLHSGRHMLADAVVIATGTFLGGRIFVGRSRALGGRWQERSAVALGLQLANLGIELGRMKTGTPPRLDGRTVDWSRLKSQLSDPEPWTMSPIGARSAPQLFCGITRTNAESHEIIRGGLAESPLLDGAITGAGPRYCPSIEDKVRRFGDRDGHQIFLEPEGLNSPLVYPNGISTSLSEAVQRALVRSVDGLEQAHIVVPGYAVEYDHVDPRQLDHTLSVRGLTGLFLAGQINGTTGYEEAAGQGLVAGLNAAALALGRPRIVLPRSESYIGVMIDDLTLQGTTEPYRMLTARAERRLHLRSDNAEARMTPIAREAACLRSVRAVHLQRRETELRSVKSAIAVLPDEDLTSFDAVSARVPSLRLAPKMLIEEVIEDRRYHPYVNRSDQQMLGWSGRDSPLPTGFDYQRVRGISVEMIERLERARPQTLAEVRRVRGITAAAVAAVAVESRQK